MPAKEPIPIENSEKDLKEPLKAREPWVELYDIRINTIYFLYTVVYPTLSNFRSVAFEST